MIFKANGKHPKVGGIREHLSREKLALCTEIKWPPTDSITEAPLTWVSNKSDESKWVAK